MKYLDFDQKRPLDLILMGRIAIDFNPAVTEDFKPLKMYTTLKNMLEAHPPILPVVLLNMV